MQQQFTILEDALNKGNGGLKIQESRNAANALDSLINTFNELIKAQKELSEENRKLKEELEPEETEKATPSKKQSAK